MTTSDNPGPADGLRLFADSEAEPMPGGWLRWRRPSPEPPPYQQGPKCPHGVPERLLCRECADPLVATVPTPSEALIECGRLVDALRAVVRTQDLELGVLRSRRRSVRHGAALRLALGAAVLSGCVGAGANAAAIAWSLGVRA